MYNLSKTAMLFTLLVGLMTIAPDAQAGRKFVTLGTAGVTGVYYPVGGTICRLVNRKSKEHGIRCSVEPTGGSIENLNAVSQNELDLAFAQSDWQYNAYNGLGVFADNGANKNLRSLFSLYSEAFTIISSKNSGISVVDALKGKNVNVGNPGSGMRATMEELMKVKGWNTSSFKVASEYKAAEQAQKLCDKQIDAFVFSTGHPNGSIQQVTSECGAKIVEIDAETVSRVMKMNSYYAPSTIPGGMYAGNPNDIHTFGVKATVVASKDVDEEVVYQVVKALFDDFDNFKTTHPILSTINKNDMVKDGLTAPLHEGAKRYYHEAGLLK